MRHEGCPQEQTGTPWLCGLQSIDQRRGIRLRQEVGRRAISLDAPLSEFWIADSLDSRDREDGLQLLSGDPIPVTAVTCRRRMVGFWIDWLPTDAGVVLLAVEIETDSEQ